MTTAHSEYVDPDNRNNNEVVIDIDTIMKYYTFIKYGTEAEINSVAPIDPKILDGIDRRLLNDFQKSTFLSKLKTELLKVSY